MLQKYGINYHRDIKTRIHYRAKTDESIQDKIMIDPKLTTASVLHDL
jgi:hypothetical protein